MTTGASNDFERATEMARRMVTQWGMSDSLGPMVYGENEGEVFLGRSVTTHKNVSEATMQKVDIEIRRIIDGQYGLARKLIEENRDKIEVMAHALLSGKPSIPIRSATLWKVVRASTQTYQSCSAATEGQYSSRRTGSDGDASSRSIRHSKRA